MIDCALLSFLTEETLLNHYRYYEEISAKENALFKGRGKPSDFELLLKREVLLHEVYFHSFKNEITIPSHVVSSEFLYQAKQKMLNEKAGFFVIFKNAKKLNFAMDYELRELPNRFLSIDLFEHSYFSDYGFHKERYIDACLCHLDYGKILENPQNRVEKKNKI